MFSSDEDLIGEDGGKSRRKFWRWRHEGGGMRLTRVSFFLLVYVMFMCL